MHFHQTWLVITNFLQFGAVSQHFFHYLSPKQTFKSFFLPNCPCHEISIPQIHCVSAFVLWPFEGPWAIVITKTCPLPILKNIFFFLGSNIILGKSAWFRAGFLNLSIIGMLSWIILPFGGCPVHYRILAATLTSAHSISISSPVLTIKNVSSLYHMSYGEQSRSLLKTPGVEDARITIWK